MIGLNTRMEQDLVQKHNAKVSKIHNQFKQQNELKYNINPAPYNVCTV